MSQSGFVNQSEPVAAQGAPGLPLEQYTVVARRYRPQTFAELVGQEHIAQALANAISTQRVGHAYLFTGARGVGKTSTARILAKALNCVHGPSPTPCNQCDICQMISAGNDLDVLEIDGASKRGIDDIRQLRDNVGIRPSRARYKIYIIDEVHMLTKEAFNALLKTLEEPPEHVKFIFCTTEPTKIPVTILSRCQRFDFAGIDTVAISQRLRQIVQAEGVEADDAALELIARRAAGSMRDGQSLLEKLLAFGSGTITVADVHNLLGTAGDERLAALLGHLASRNAAGALQELAAAVEEGVEVSLLLEQLLGYFRDCMAAAAGCPTSCLMYASAENRQMVVELGGKLGLCTVLAAMQIFDSALGRMRYSTQTRIIAELALVRICQLAELEELAGIVAQLRGAGVLGGATAAGPPAVSRTPAAAALSAAEQQMQSAAASGRIAPAAGTPGPSAEEPPAKKKYEQIADRPAVAVAQDEAHLSAAFAGGDEDAEQAEQSVFEQPFVPDAPAPGSPAETTCPPAATPDAAATRLWMAALARLSGMVVEHAKKYAEVAMTDGDRLLVSFSPQYTLAKSLCEQPDNLKRIESALAEVAGRRIAVQFCIQQRASQSAASAQEQPRPVSPRQRMLEAFKHPLVRRAVDLFGAQPM